MENKMSVPQVLAGYPQLQMNSSPSEIPSGYSANIEDPNATPFSDKVLNQALNAPSAEMPKIENNLFPNLLMGAVGAAAVYGGVKGIQSLTNGGKTDKDKDKDKDTGTDTGTDKKTGIGQKIAGVVKDGLGSAVQGLFGGKGKIPTTVHPKPKVHADKPAAHASTPTESNSRPGLERQSAQRHLESKNDSETKSPKKDNSEETARLFEKLPDSGAVEITPKEQKVERDKRKETVKLFAELPGSDAATPKPKRDSTEALDEDGASMQNLFKKPETASTTQTPTPGGMSAPTMQGNGNTFTLYS